MPKFTQPADGELGMYTNVSKLCCSSEGVCILLLCGWEHAPSTVRSFISFNACESHLCLVELDVKSKVTSAVSTWERERHRAELFLPGQG